MQHTRALSEPLCGSLSAKGKEKDLGTRSNAGRPTTPTSQILDARLLDARLEVSSKRLVIQVVYVHVARIMVDQSSIILYKNCEGVIYGTMFSTSKLYPFENVLHVLWDKEGNVLTIEDDHHNNYMMIVK